MSKKRAANQKSGPTVPQNFSLFISDQTHLLPSLLMNNHYCTHLFVDLFSATEPQLEMISLLTLIKCIYRRYLFPSVASDPFVGGGPASAIYCQLLPIKYFHTAGTFLTFSANLLLRRVDFGIWLKHHRFEVSRGLVSVNGDHRICLNLSRLGVYEKSVFDLNSTYFGGICGVLL